MCQQGPGVLQRTLEQVEKLFGKFFSEIRWINFGGGHHVTREGYDVDLLCDIINDFRDRTGLDVYLEPGEAHVLKTGFMVTTVLDIVENIHSNNIAIVDTSAAAHMPDILEMPYTPEMIGAEIIDDTATDVPLDEFSNKYILGGKTCLSGDVIGGIRRRPPPARRRPARPLRHGAVYDRQKHHVQRDPTAVPRHLRFGKTGRRRPHPQDVRLRGFQRTSVVTEPCYTTGTFLGLPPEHTNPATAKYAVIPVPYEGTVCFLKGTAAAPKAIVDVSCQMEWFDEETREEFYRVGIATDEAVRPAETPEAEVAAVRDRVQTWLARGTFPILLGGEHSITLGAVQAMVEQYKDVSVLQFDAHADLRDSFTGGKYSHASVMRRVLEHTDSVVQVGIRSFSKEEADECPPQIERIITPRRFARDRRRTIETILYRLGTHVYVTFDMDVFDPSVAPGVGTPEPGGLRYADVMSILRAVVHEKTLVGADVVETLPLGGNQITTEFLAARLVGKIIAYCERREVLTRIQRCEEGTEP